MRHATTTLVVTSSLVISLALALCSGESGATGTDGGTGGVQGFYSVSYGGGGARGECGNPDAHE